MTKEDFLATQDPRVEKLESSEDQALLRTKRLILQSAVREGLLADCDFEVDQQSLKWSRGNCDLVVVGKMTCDQDRLFLSSCEKATLEEFLETLKILAGIDEDQAWRDFAKEMKEALVTQAASYACMKTREKPQSYLDFEAWTPEGHNLHPGAKTRAGFTAQDQLRYAPDFAQSLDLVWLEVDKDLLSCSGEIPEQFRAEDSWILPCHPWQRDNVIPKLYKAEWESGRIRDFDREPLTCHLCTSLRTVVPASAEFPVLKTSVGSLMTSTTRSMSPYTVMQGPLYSRYLSRIFAQEPSFRDKVVALEESGGFYWKTSDDEKRARNFSLLFRQRPPKVEGIAVPCSALPQSQQAGSTNYFSHFFSQGAGVIENFQSYLKLLIPFHLELYLRHGLALEAHLQNCVMVWTHEGPTKLWVRDWGGLRADGERLAKLAPDILAQLNPNSVTLSTAEAAEKKLLACLYCNHITEVVANLACNFGLPENELWEKVYKVSQRCLSPYKETSLAHRILCAEWPVKCLMRMRLQDTGGDAYRMRKNPLIPFQTIKA